MSKNQRFWKGPKYVTKCPKIFFVLKLPKLSKILCSNFLIKGSFQNSKIKQYWLTNFTNQSSKPLGLIVSGQRTWVKTDSQCRCRIEYSEFICKKGCWVDRVGWGHLLHGKQDCCFPNWLFLFPILPLSLGDQWPLLHW